MPAPLISACPVPGCSRTVRRAGLCEPHAREGHRLHVVREKIPARPHALEILRAVDRAARVDELEARLLESDLQREAMGHELSQLQSVQAERDSLREAHLRDADRIAHLERGRAGVVEMLEARKVRIDDLEAQVGDLTGKLIAGAAVQARDAARIAELEAEVERARLDGEIRVEAQTAREIEGYARAGNEAAALRAEIAKLQAALQAETERRVAAERSAKGADALAEAVWKLKGRPEAEQRRTPGPARRAA